MLACGRDTRSARQIMPTDIGTPRLLAPLLHRPCAVPPMCTQFMVQAWRPYQQRIASASISDDKRRCWRTELPPASFGIGDTLGLVVPLAAEALLNDAALDVMVSVTGEVASSVYATLGMLREKDARAQCSPLSAKKISHEQTRKFQQSWAFHDTVKHHSPHVSDVLGPPVNTTTSRGSLPPTCLLRMMLSCPSGHVAHLVKQAKALLPSGGYVAVHARLGANSYAIEKALMNGISDAYTNTTDLTN